MRDYKDFSNVLLQRIGSMETVFPLSLLMTSFKGDNNLKRDELYERMKKLTESLNTGGIPMDRLTDAAGSLLPKDLLIDQPVISLNSNPPMFIQNFNPRHIIDIDNNYVRVNYPELKEWYASNILHLFL